MQIETLISCTFVILFVVEVAAQLGLLIVQMLILPLLTFHQISQLFLLKVKYVWTSNVFLAQIMPTEIVW